MLKYNFNTKYCILNGTGEDITYITTIKYKCLICGYEHEYDRSWTDEKKAEVKAEVDAHHNEHNIDETTDV